MSCGSWHYAPCEDCGCSKLTRQNGGYAILCKECKQLRRQAKDKRYNDRRGYHHTIDIGSIIVVYDPICFDDGGYSVGAAFNQKEVEFMLQATYCGFTEGTEVVNSIGEVFMVLRKPRGKGGMELCPM